MDSAKRADVIHDLEMKYQHHSHQTTLVVKDEESRRMKLRSMVLRDENSSLKDVTNKRENRIKDLLEEIKDTRSQMISLRDKCRRQDKVLQSQTRQIANLTTEIAAFGSLTQDSAKMLSEKLALTREIAVLKPEIEHLQSQLAHQKDVLAEKLALERQFNTLEVELANTKRAAEKASRKQDQDSQDEADLRKQVQELEKQLLKERKIAQKNLQGQENKNNEAEAELEGLREQLAALEKGLAAEKEKRTEMEEELENLRQTAAEAEKALAVEKRNNQLKVKSQAGKTSAIDDELAELREKLASSEKALAAEKKENQRLQKEHEDTLADVELRQEAINAKVEKMRSKLRETQEELKEARADQERGRMAVVSMPKVTTTTVPLKKPAAKPPSKKRPVSQISLEESILETPGQDDRKKRLAKKKAFDPSTLGKSEFSITPFLNKTINISDESMKIGADEATRAVPTLQLRSEEDTTTAVDAEPTATEVTVDDEPAPAASKPEKKPRANSKAKVLSDAPSSRKNLTSRSSKSSLTESTLEKVAEEPDEEDEGQENRSMESAVAKTAEAKGEAEPKKKKRKLLGASNKPSLFDEDEGERVTVTKKPPKAVLGGPKAKVMMGGARSAFAGASFSPLKRDKRGVGASFLA
ncbi:hypothetical protein OQA88_9739 [Cercophora sp. LCS_1]